VLGRPDDSLLDTYEPERIGFARRLVATTDQAFTAVTSSGPFARWIRLDVVPVLFPLVFRSRAVQRLLFRTVSQTNVNYRSSPLSEGRAGRIRGGDRLPWVRTGAESTEDNFAPLASCGWQVHVYGPAASGAREVSERRGFPLHVFAWDPRFARAGLRRKATYLVRPDGYLGLVDPQSRPATLNSYLDRHGILPGPGPSVARRMTSRESRPDVATPPARAG
jgi:hypothetical protein